MFKLALDLNWLYTHECCSNIFTAQDIKCAKMQIKTRGVLAKIIYSVLFKRHPECPICFWTSTFPLIQPLGETCTDYLHFWHQKCSIWALKLHYRTSDLTFCLLLEFLCYYNADKPRMCLLNSCIKKKKKKCWYKSWIGFEVGRTVIKHIWVTDFYQER